MFALVAKLALAVVVVVVVGLLCQLFGVILISFAVPFAVAVGSWLVQWGWVLGACAGVWYFFAGGFTWPPVWRRP